MKLAFELIIIPPALYHCGEGSVKRETVVVEIPDDLIPERIRKGMEKDADFNREYASKITYVTDGNNNNVKRYNEN